MTSLSSLTRPGVSDRTNLMEPEDTNKNRKVTLGNDKIASGETLASAGRLRLPLSV